jgi:2-keto-4-pentenoate hydratase/2-oxohepta-3-ene-1,7-dioic acid hydratase in catechol pathway
MHLVRYLTANDETAIGVRCDGGVVPTGYTDMLGFIGGGDEALEIARSAQRDGSPITPKRVLAPLVNPGKMLFLGMTYDVFRQDVPADQEPYVYARVQSSIIGPGDPIRVPRVDAHLIYEGELVVVIGRPMHRVAAGEAMSHVFGYTQANDVTWTQWIHGATKVGPQICLSKNADTFCPLGPDVVTADDVDPANLSFTVSVNGEERTRSSTRGLVWTVAGILEFLCRDMTLWPGDLISTGTSDAQDIVAGDRVVVEFAGLGTLENPVVAGWE